jgi:chromosome segregation ATPase
MGQVSGERIGDSRDAGHLLIQQDAQALRRRLDSAFRLAEVDSEEMDWVVEDRQARASALEPSFAAAAARQARALEEEQVERDSETAHLKEAVRNLCAALDGVMGEARKTSSATAEKIESLTDTLAIVAGQVAARRQDAKALANKLETSEAAHTELKTGIEAGRDEILKLQERMLSVDQAVLQGLAALQDSVSSLRAELQETNRRVAEVEEQNRSNSERLEAVEQRAEQSSRREKVMAAVLARTARLLQPSE